MFYLLYYVYTRIVFLQISMGMFCLLTTIVFTLMFGCARLVTCAILLFLMQPNGLVNDTTKVGFYTIHTRWQLK